MRVKEYFIVHSCSGQHYILPVPCIQPHREQNAENIASLSRSQSTWNKDPGRIVLPTQSPCYGEYCVPRERRDSEPRYFFTLSFCEDANLQEIELPTALFLSLVPLADIWPFPTGTWSNGANYELPVLEFGQS